MFLAIIDKRHKHCFNRHVFPTSHLIRRLQDPLLWGTSTKLLRERQLSVGDKDDGDFGLHIQPQPKILKQGHSMGNDPVD